MRGFESPLLRHVGAKFALLRRYFLQNNVIRPLPCSSFPNRTHFVGLRFGSAWPCSCFSSVRSKRHTACHELFYSSRAHSAAPHFQLRPAALGSQLGILRQSSLCSDVIFYKITSSARFLAPPFQIEPTSLGFDLVQPGPAAASLLFATSVISLATNFFALRALILLLLTSNCDPLRWAHSRNFISKRKSTCFPRKTGAFLMPGYTAPVPAARFCLAAALAMMAHSSRVAKSLGRVPSVRPMFFASSSSTVAQPLAGWLARSLR